MIVRMTEWQLPVSVRELRRSVDLLMDHIEAASSDGVIRLDQDYFWSIPKEELYDPLRPPEDLTLGQLSWSWEHLTDLLEDPEHVIGYHLVWLSEVLRVIGQEIS